MMSNSVMDSPPRENPIAEKEFESHVSRFGDKGTVKEDESDANRGSSSALLHHFNKVESVAKVGRNLLRDEILSEEIASVQLLQQQRGQKMAELVKAREQKKILWVLERFPQMTEEEVILGLLDCGDDEQLLVDSLSVVGSNFLENIKSRIESSADRQDWQISSHSGVEPAETTRMRRSSQVKRARKKSVVTTANSDEIGDVTSGMSEAQKKAYAKLDANPNEYYYRFNARGEAQRTQVWTEGEKALFMKRLEECGAEGQWGIFSKVIPGRVGYQCSNFYRSLLKKKELVDPRYYLNENGEPKLVKNKDRKAHTKNPKKRPLNGDSDSTRRPRRKKVLSSKTQTRVSSEDDDEVEYKPRNTTRRLRIKTGELNEADLVDNENPLPGFLDCITFSEVVMPTISPAGHVLSYSSWLQCLECSSTCPFTGVPIDRRDLIVLTPQNIEVHREKIICPE